MSLDLSVPDRALRRRQSIEAGIGESESARGAPVRSPSHRFNDVILAPAAAFWVALAERLLQEVEPT